ncbi:TIGR02117 family protein [Desertivirga xinjiangensis]|uniref:TIGR02117 family protein n=1 Tax=Desertivirga xinjiangensis TaxID=539206 RepID=UPI00210D700B|nr:TIGR02117 family protein [Pedobacter xinjiangensis]
MKKIVKIFLSSVLCIILLVLVYAGSAYVLSRVGTSREASGSNDVAIYILTNDVHTDVAVPIKSPYKDWSREIKFLNTLKKDTAFKYVAMGWGDKGFYLETPTWEDLKASTAFKAAFSLSTSAIHTTFYKTLKEDNTCVKIDISAHQYQRLVTYIENSFKRDPKGHFMFIPTTANYGNDDAFYDAVGSYSLFHTCNTWANNALKSCGQKASFWTPFDTGIFYQYKN